MSHRTRQSEAGNKQRRNIEDVVDHGHGHDPGFKCASENPSEPIEKRNVVFRCPKEGNDHQAADGSRSPQQQTFRSQAKSRELHDRIDQHTGEQIDAQRLPTANLALHHHTKHKQEGQVPQQMDRISVHEQCRKPLHRVHGAQIDHQAFVGVRV